jgi:hypothetical protein
VSINRELSETENKIYLIFSLIFEKIMDEQGYQMGSYTWNKIRPNLMKQVGLDDELWTGLSDSGDKNDGLQERLAGMSEKFGGLSLEELLKDFLTIFASPY